MATDKPGTRKGRLPRFKSLEEEAAFWENQSPLDYSEFKEVKADLPRLGHILAVRLDGPTLDLLGTMPRKKGIGPSTLARMWLLERLDQEPPNVPPRPEPVRRAGRLRSQSPTTAQPHR
jgi:hypothetical protein